MKKMTVALAFCLALSTPALAQVIVPGAPTEEARTDGFVGLTIPFGQKGIEPPHITVGVRRVNVTSGGSVTGGEMSLSVDPFDIGNSRLRVTALAGDPSLQGSLGLGLILGSRQVFATGGVLGAHTALLADVDPSDWSVDLFLQGNTLGGLEAPEAEWPIVGPPPTPIDPCIQTSLPVCFPSSS